MLSLRLPVQVHLSAVAPGTLHAMPGAAPAATVHGPRSFSPPSSACCSSAFRGAEIRRPQVSRAALSNNCVEELSSKGGPVHVCACGG